MILIRTPSRFSRAPSLRSLGFCWRMVFLRPRYNCDMSLLCCMMDNAINNTIHIIWELIVLLITGQCSRWPLMMLWFGARLCKNRNDAWNEEYSWVWFGSPNQNQLSRAARVNTRNPTTECLGGLTRLLESPTTNVSWARLTRMFENKKLALLIALLVQQRK